MAHEGVLDVLCHREDGDVVVAATHHRQVGVAQLAALMAAGVLSHEVVVPAVQRVGGVSFVARRLRVQVLQCVKLRVICIGNELTRNSDVQTMPLVARLEVRRTVLEPVRDAGHAKEGVHLKSA